VVLLTTPLFVVAGRVGTIEALLAVHVLAVVALDLAGPRDERAVHRAVAIGGLIGLAFLAKGPVGLILPLLILLAGRTAVGRDVLPSVRGFLLGTAAGIAVVLPWGLAFVNRVGIEATLRLLRAETFDRFHAGTDHVEPFWYYGKVIGVGFLPWLAPLGGALLRAWKLRGSPESVTARYAAGGLLAALIFLSWSKGKLPTYLVPLAPLVALLVTWELGREIEAPRRRTLVPTLLAATVAACGLLLGFATLRLEGVADGVARAGALVFGIAALPAVWGAVRCRPRVVYATTAAASWLFLLVAAAWLMPELGRTRSAAVLVRQVTELEGARPVVTVEMQAPSLVFYLDRPVEVIDLHELAPRLARPDRPVLVFADVDLPRVPPDSLARLREVGRHAKFRAFVESDPDPTAGP
jgi:4-amino-4-deoxy-L-arabinose transferase